MRGRSAVASRPIAALHVVGSRRLAQPHANPLICESDQLEHRRGGVVKNGKGQTKKPAQDKPKAVKVKPAKQAKVAHRSKTQ